MLDFMHERYQFDSGCPPMVPREKHIYQGKEILTLVPCWETFIWLIPAQPSAFMAFLLHSIDDFIVRSISLKVWRNLMDCIDEIF